MGCCGRRCSNRSRVSGVRTGKVLEKKMKTPGQGAIWGFGSPHWTHLELSSARLHARFGCRQCHKLSYTSRDESPHDRVMERARGIRLRLGGTPSLLDQFPDKPKGMRWKRYQRLQDQYEYYNNASLQFLMERLQLKLQTLALTTRTGV